MLCPRCKARVTDTERAQLPDPRRCPKDGWKLIADRSGEGLGPFVLKDFLGIGGGGSSVWVATETLSQHPHQVRDVALKLLPLKDNDQQEQARFERGAILAESLDHPHVARVYAHGRLSTPSGDLLWVSMELLAGDTLAAAASGRRIFPPREAVEIADQILAALEVAHEGGIVHRDLKPANLYVTPRAYPAGTPPTPHVRILDFGIARLTGQSAAERFGPFFPDDEPVAPELEGEVTGQHRICGTPEYMAPEQILGGPPDTRSDLYALGVILFRLLTGQLPFRARTRYEIYHRHLHEAPPSLPPEIAAPTSLAAAVFRALQKKPEERFAHAREMRECLRESVGLPPIRRPRLFPTEESARPIPNGLAPALSVLPTSDLSEAARSALEVSIHRPLPTAPTPSLEVSIQRPLPSDRDSASTPTGTNAPPAGRTRFVVIALAAIALIGLGVGVGLAFSGDRVAAHPRPPDVNPTSSAH